MSGVIYTFEDVAEDLPRPPMAAMRAFLAAGVVLSPRGWASLSIEGRRAFLVAGSQPIVDAIGVQAALRNATVSEVRLVPRVLDPNPNEIPASLANALGPHGRITNGTWAQLRPLDRYVLATLALNTRLLFRAVSEILPDTGAASLPWKAAVAHVEMTMHPKTLERLRAAEFLDGRAFMLARVAGVRAARRAQETFDIRSERATGTIELDWAPLEEPGRILWQAHVSSWDGAFYAAAALVAASTAAVAIADMVAEEDKTVTFLGAKISEEPWQVGGESREQPTTVFSGNDFRKQIDSLTPNSPSQPNLNDTARTGEPSFGDTARMPSGPLPSSPSSSGQLPAQPQHASPMAGRPSAPSPQPMMRAPATVPPQAQQPSLTPSKKRRERNAPVAQNNVLLWAMFAVLTIVVAALVGVILALLSRK